MKSDSEITLDVRPILAGGEDPFNKIMEVVKSVKPNGTLVIINTFEPIPLIHKLENLGFTSRVERVSNDLVHTFFIKNNTEISLSEDEDTISNENFDTVFKRYIGKTKHVDVRMLEMPEPMTTILEELEQLPENNCLFVDHKKVPQFLLPELDERGFDILYNKKSDNHLQLLIFKK